MDQFAAKSRPRTSGDASGGWPGRGPGGPALAAAPDRGLLHATLDALSAHIAVVDATGMILAVNRAWRRFAREGGYEHPDCGVGANYLAVCEVAAASSPEARTAAAGLREVIAGRRAEFRSEYACDAPAGRRWFQLRVTRPRPIVGGWVVAAHEDITEAKRAEQSLAELTGRLLTVQDDERRRLARELHDSTAQNLLSVTLNLARMRQLLSDGDTPRACEFLADTLKLADRGMQEVRTLSYLLHPPLLDEMGLASAVRWYAAGFARRSGIDVDVAVEDGRRGSGDVELAIFRVLQEALSNIHRHSGSRTARVALRYGPDAMALSVRDAGKGIAPRRMAEAQSLGVGISGMRLRLAQLGGTLRILSHRRGTEVLAELPMTPRAAVRVRRRKPSRGHAGK
jgi:signal transduction histidine kinase